MFIDGLDTRPTDIDYTEYKECIYPLVRAVYDLNNDIFAHIKDRNKGALCPVHYSKNSMRSSLNPQNMLNMIAGTNLTRLF